MSLLKGNAAKAIAPWLLAGILAAAPAALVFASETDAGQGPEQELITRSEYVTDKLIGLSEEDIAKYKESTDDVTAALAEAWESSAEELGALNGAGGETTVEVKNGEYTVTVPRDFEKADADFVYIYDRKLNQQASSINVKLPLGLTLARALANTVMGILIVFLMLAFLSFIISRLQYVPELVDKLTKKPESGAVPQAPARAAAPQAAVVNVPAAEENLMDDGELAAVITAAIAAAQAGAGGASQTSGFVVRSIRKSRKVR